MPKPIVSVVIAVKNGERFLASAIDSILQQAYPADEIIVVDGQSTDRTAAIARSFNEIQHIVQTNPGIADAWNVGIEAARGNLIAFLSHDDLWTPEKLDVQVKYMVKHPDVQYTIARIKFFLEPGFPIPTGFRKELLQGDHIGSIMETLVARVSLFDDIGRFNPQLTSAEDVEWFARAKDNQIPMAIIPEVLLHKRIHDMNITSNLSLAYKNMMTALRQSIHRKQASGEYN